MSEHDLCELYHPNKPNSNYAFGSNFKFVSRKCKGTTIAIGYSTKKLVLVIKTIIFHFNDKYEGNNKKFAKFIINKLGKKLEHLGNSNSDWQDCNADGNCLKLNHVAWKIATKKETCSESSEDDVFAQGFYAHCTHCGNMVLDESIFRAETSEESTGDITEYYFASKRPETKCIMS